MREGGRQDAGVRVARAVRVDRLDARRRNVGRVLIAGIRRCPGGAHKVCALGTRAHEDGPAQQAEHCARCFARLTAPVADARIPSLLSDLLGLPVVHRHDDPVGGQPIWDTDHGGDVQDDTHALGQDVQRRFRGLTVRGVIHQIAVDVEHVARTHGAHEVSPRARGCRRLGTLRGDEGALARAVRKRDAEPVVNGCDAWPEVRDPLARQRRLDERGVRTVTDWAEGDGLGPHASGRHEGVEAAAHVHSLVDGPHVAARGGQSLAAHGEVHEDLPHEDDAARRGGGRRGRAWLLYRRVGIGIGSW